MQNLQETDDSAARSLRHALQWSATLGLLSLWIYFSSDSFLVDPLKTTKAPFANLDLPFLFVAFLIPIFIWYFWLSAMKASNPLYAYDETTPALPISRDGLICSFLSLASLSLMIYKLYAIFSLFVLFLLYFTVFIVWFLFSLRQTIWARLFSFAPIPLIVVVAITVHEFWPDVYEFRRSLVLNGADLSKRALQESDFTDARARYVDFSRANLVGANLSRIDLTRADLSDTNFVGARLMEATLVEAIAPQANFAGALIRNADFSGIRAERTNFSRFVPMNGDENNAVSNLRPRAKRASVRYAGCNKFNFARLHEANFAGLRLEHSFFGSTDLSGAVLYKSDISDSYLGPMFTEMELTYNLNFSFVMDRAVVGRISDDSSLRDALLSYFDHIDELPPGTATLVGASLRGANLKGADLTNTYMVFADLRDASFDENTKLEGAVLFGANLRGHSSQNLSCEQLQVAKYWEYTFREEGHCTVDSDREHKVDQAFGQLVRNMRLTRMLNERVKAWNEHCAKGL